MEGAVKYFDGSGVDPPAQPACTHAKTTVLLIVDQEFHGRKCHFCQKKKGRRVLFVYLTVIHFE